MAEIADRRAEMDRAYHERMADGIYRKYRSKLSEHAPDSAAYHELIIARDLEVAEEFGFTGALAAQNNIT
jgi:hypothetical protein